MQVVRVDAFPSSTELFAVLFRPGRAELYPVLHLGGQVEDLRSDAVPPRVPLIPGKPLAKSLEFGYASLLRRLAHRHPAHVQRVALQPQRLACRHCEDMDNVGDFFAIGILVRFV